MAGTMTQQTRNLGTPRSASPASRAGPQPQFATVILYALGLSSAVSFQEGAHENKNGSAYARKQG